MSNSWGRLVRQGLLILLHSDFQRRARFATDKMKRALHFFPTWWWLRVVVSTFRGNRPLSQVRSIVFRKSISNSNFSFRSRSIKIGLRSKAIFHEMEYSYFTWAPPSRTSHCATPACPCSQANISGVSPSLFARLVSAPASLTSQRTTSRWPLRERENGALNDTRKENTPPQYTINHSLNLFETGFQILYNFIIKNTSSSKKRNFKSYIDYIMKKTQSFKGVKKKDRVWEAGWGSEGQKRRATYHADEKFNPCIFI